MARRNRPDEAGPCCWRCAAPVPPQRVEVEAVLRTRTAEDGGPYRLWTCACGAECGALRNAAGDWLLHPLEGLAEPGLLDRLVPRTSRDALREAVAWWERHLADVERFRRAATPRDAAPPPPPPPPPRPRRPPPRARRRPVAPPPRDDVDTRSPCELLGVEPGADARTVRSAYRRALKLCHPDRVANLDPEIQELAHRKSKALRRAYEQLLREREAN